MPQLVDGAIMKIILNKQRTIATVYYSNHNINIVADNKGMLMNLLHLILG